MAQVNAWQQLRQAALKVRFTGKIHPSSYKSVVSPPERSENAGHFLSSQERTYAFWWRWCLCRSMKPGCSLS